jgi:iron complex outermembrane receptor protein
MTFRFAGRRPALRWCALASFAATTAHADDAARTLAPVEVRETAPSTLDTDDETASRLALSARETPAAIITLDETQLAERGARTSIEALNTAPGVVAANLPSSPGMTSMRGFAGGAISLLHDGMRVTAGPLVTRDLDTWSFERIEVLKGPASVLYGEGALAGAVNLVPKRPSLDDVAWRSTLSAGSHGQVRAGVDLNTPLTDTTALRAVAVGNRSDGYVDDTTGASAAGAVSLRIDPNDALRVDVAIDHYRDDYDTPYWGTPLVPRAVARDPSGVASSANGYVIDRALRERNFNVDDGYSNARATWLRSRVVWNLDDTWRFINELDRYDATRRWQNTETYTWDATAANLRRSTTRLTHQHDYWVERATFAADADIAGQRNRFAVGAEYSASDFYNVRRFGTTSPVDPYAAVPVRGNFPVGDEATLFPGAGNRVDFDSQSTVRAIFLENALNLGSRWLVVAGLRRDHIALDRAVVDGNAGTRTTFERTYSPLSWRVGTVFDVAPRTQLYAQYNRAVAPVGSLFLLSAANAKFELTTGTAIEAGVKSTLWNGRLDLTAAAYRLVQDDIVTRDPANPNIAVQGGRQSSRGVELGASVRVTPSLRLDANLAALDARFDALVEAGGVNRAGNTPANVPERVASVFAIYDVTDTPLSLSLGARHVGRWYANNANTLRVAAHTVVDAAATWRLPLGELTLRGRNLGDTLYADWTGGAADQLVLGAPRSVELTWSVTR